MNCQCSSNTSAPKGAFTYYNLISINFAEFMLFMVVYVCVK